MIYTDRPASEYWKDYILAPDHHQEAEIRGDLRLVDRFFKYLASSFEMEQQDIDACESQILPDWQRFQCQSPQTIVEELKGTIEDFGIHDWGKEPYSAACHAWRPNTKSWEVIVRLRAFSSIDDQDKHKNIHICGEAYSDYQGFIEGALRSAQGVLDWIEAQEKTKMRSLQCL
ncbi:MAG: FAD-dependent oxidoreductase [Xenococcaceae cyanobacterium MO_188.B32]|nr:FAD-dependent oxidoreductase [Xenococcaceae cyanobacterium MO_188.B32]